MKSGNLPLDHFKSILTQDNRERFNQIFKDCFEELEEQDIDELEVFNIPSQKQEEFNHYLTQKYGTQFSENVLFMAQVRDAFRLEPNAENSRERHHVLKLLGLTNFYNDEGLPSLNEVNRDNVAETLVSSNRHSYFSPQSVGSNSNALANHNQEDRDCSLGELFWTGFYNCLSAVYWAILYLISTTLFSGSTAEAREAPVQL